MSLTEAKENCTYIINAIDAQDEDMKSFLFTLGCYKGQEISLISKKKHSIVISLKEARYNIDSRLGDAIKIEMAYYL